MAKTKDLPTTRSQGKRTGPGLKPGLNEADTFGVVHQVKGTVSFGRMSVSGNDPKRNSMVSGNGGMKRGSRKK